MKKYYVWPTEEAFNLWHEPVKVFLGIPHPNKNAKGEIDENAQWTLQYTNGIVFSEGCFAMVESEIAERFPENLGEEFIFEEKFILDDNAT